MTLRPQFDRSDRSGAGRPPAAPPLAVDELDGWRSTWRALWVVAGWLLLAGVAGVLVLRWWDLDRPLLIGLVGLTPLLALPLAGAVVAAWLGRSRSLRLGMLVVAASFLYTTSPIDAVIGCAADDHPDPITVYTANVWFDGGRPADVAAAILAEEADVFVLQEVRPDFLAELSADGRLDAYAHRQATAGGGTGGGPTGNVLWSRWPISETTVEPFGTSRLLTATIEGPDGPFDLTVVHALAPASRSNVRVWKEQFRQLETIDTSTPRILAGDFNATMDHHPFRSLVDRGWTDVHEERGCGFDATWPVGDDEVPFPLLRLDHVLVTDHFRVVAVRFGDPGGSDHRPVVAEVVRVEPSG